MVNVGTHVYYIISITTTCFHDDYILQQMASGTSANVNMETCVLHHFHDNYILFEQQQIAFLLHSSNLLMGDSTWYT